MTLAFSHSSAKNSSADWTPASAFLAPAGGALTQDYLVVLAATNSFLINPATGATSWTLVQTTLSPADGAMIDTTLAAIIQSGTTTALIVDVTNGGTNNTSQASMAFAYTSNRSQQVAGIPASKIGYAITDTPQTIIKYDVSGTPTISKINPSWMGSVNTSNEGFLATCIITAAGGFIVGCKGGHIAEVDSSFNVVKSYNLPQLQSQVGISASTISRQIVIHSMSYLSGHLLVGTNCGMFLMDHGTGKLVYRQFAQFQDNDSQGIMLARDTTTITTFMGMTTTPGSTNVPLMEIDFHKTPIDFKSIAFVTASQGTPSIGVCTVSGVKKVWALCRSSATQVVRFFTWTGERAYTGQAGSLVDSVAVEGQQAIIDITSGITSAQMMSHSPIAAAGKTMQVETSKTMLKLATYGTGVAEKFSVNRATS
jgi:hypothetical protein